MDQLKAFFAHDLVGGNTVGILFTFIGALILTLAGAKLAQLLFRGRLRALAKKSKTRIDDILLATFEKPIYWIVLAGGFGLSLGVLSLPGGLESLVGHVITLVVITFFAWSLSSLVTALRGTYVDPMIEKSESRFDDQIVPIVEKSVKVTIWAFAILIAFDNVGFDVVSLVTGLGIGGIALAMAAKDTLANFFGSLTVFTDQPFQVGDVISLKGQTGTVTEIGLRTCRLKTFEGTVITVPNSLLVGDMVENLSARNARKFSGTIGLVYETTSEQLDGAMAALREILAANDEIRDDYAILFGNFGDSALEITVKYWVAPPDNFFSVVSDVNLAIKRRFDAEGWDMAFPSMTVYKGA